MKVKVKGGTKDVPLSEVTAANYIVPSKEVRFWHVLQEKVEFDRNTGKRLSRPVLQKYDKKTFPATEKYLKDAGYTITVLHDPVTWERANAAAIAENRRKVAAAKAAKEKKAAEKKAAEEREAIKEELRKELLEEMEKEKKVENENQKK